LISKNTGAKAQLSLPLERIRTARTMMMKTIAKIRAKRIEVSVCASHDAIG